MKKSLVFVFLIVTSYYNQAKELPLYQKNDSYFQQAQAKIEHKKAKLGQSQKAKNIILFLGDGMSLSTITAARAFQGQQQRSLGEQSVLSFEDFPYTALIKTYNTNQQVPDSAGTMTAITTGVKTKAGVLSVTKDVPRGNCKKSQSKKLVTILDLMAEANKSTGIVSTARITHATPAALYANLPERDWENDSEMSLQAKKQGCKDIAWQLIESDKGKRIKVILGGGRGNFLPKTQKDIEGHQGKRSDGKNLISDWKKSHPQGVYMQTIDDFNQFQGTEKPILGLFNSSHMRYEADRNRDEKGEPSLAQMTEKAISVLEKNTNGFFLMVEGGRIDHANHAGNAYNALNDTLAFAKAVKVAKQMTDDQETLILVTSDHSHALTLSGYPTRGNPILGYVVTNDKHGKSKSQPDLAKDGKPYTTINYTSGLGFHDLAQQTDADKVYGKKPVVGRKDPGHTNPQLPGYHQEALLPLGSATHSSEDVVLYATGPGAKLASSTLEQNVIFHIMTEAAGLSTD